MTKTKPIKTSTAVELAQALNLNSAHAYEWEVQATLLKKLKEVCEKHNLTHAKIALSAKTSRTRITAILNGNLDNVSTDLLIRILGSLGYEAKISIVKNKLAA